MEIPKAVRTPRHVQGDNGQPDQPLPERSATTMETRAAPAEGSLTRRITSTPEPASIPEEPALEPEPIQTPESEPVEPTEDPGFDLRKALEGGMSVKEAARLAGVSQSTVRNRIRVWGLEGVVTTRKKRTRKRDTNLEGEGARVPEHGPRKRPTAGDDGATSPIASPSSNSLPTESSVSADAEYHRALGVLTDAHLRTGIPLSLLLEAGRIISKR